MRNGAIEHDPALGGASNMDLASASAITAGITGVVC